jgi:antitoxin component HigA of HigAB toxin-antitoxin module
MTGMTSPSRPWFRWQPAEDPDLANNHEVKLWLSQVEMVCRGILQRSNFYNTAYTVYTELGGFGTAPLYRQKSFDTVIRFRPFTAGEYVIAENDEGKVDTLGRQFTMTVAQVVRRFVQSKYTGPMNWQGVSRATKRMWQNQQYDDLVPVIHMMMPRSLTDRDYKGGALDMPFKSCYFEEGADNDNLLQESGYKKFPAYVPRWDVLSGDMYGRGPGMDTLGDIKQLQHQQKRKAQAIDKMVDPPMVAPTSMRGKPSSVLPGHTTYVDPQQGGGGFVPAYQVTPRIGEMQQDIAEVQERIQRGFYADLFAMMINSDRREMTATEVAERHEEKLVLLGPVLQRLNIELLDPLLDDVFDFALEAGLLPEPPAALLDTNLKIEYVSLLAQAQQAVGASSLERTMAFAGNLAGVFPDIVDVLDADHALRQYSEILGNDPELTVDEGEVATIRAKRAEAQQQAAQAEQAANAAQSAKVLSEADTQSPNALTDLLGSGSTIG